MEFEKIYGATERQDGLKKIGRKKYEAFYGYGTDGGESGYNWRKQWKGKAPTLDEVKADIIALINTLTAEKIKTGYEWSGISVWLSAENQRNFQDAYLLAERSEGSNLPLTLKIGEDADGEPVYETFDDVDTLGEFVNGMVEFTYNCLQAGWTEKDGIDWTLYEISNE